MQNVLKIVKELQGTNSSNEKIEILKSNQGNDLLKKVLFYTYNPFMKYKVSEKMLEKLDDGIAIDREYSGDVFNLLDELSSSNINDSLRDTVKLFLQDDDDELKNLYKMMILKDLRCSISEKTVNKVWKKLIPTFNVMLASKYYDNIKKVEGNNFILTTKLDGIRCVMWRIGSTVYAYTRQGKEILGLEDIEKEFIRAIPEKMVLDGELLMINNDNLESKDLYRATMKIVRKDGIKKDVVFNVFDCLPLKDFENGKCETGCIHRKKMLHTGLKNKDLKFIKEVELLYFGDKLEVVETLLKIAIERGEEGLMVNLADAPYECKRTKGILKVKVFQSCDLKIIGFEEGTGKYVGKLGALILDYKGNNLGCGTGLSDDDREYIWNNRDNLLGRVAEISYFEETQNQNGGLGLRFPVYKSIREVGKEVSYE